LIAVADRVDPTAFVRFGFFLGTAFQIQDDVLNLIGDEAAYGKETCGDLREGKRTLMLIRLLQLATADERARLIAHLATPLPARPAGPPFNFDGVTVRVFPLRAHAHALQRLCDTYLNLNDQDPDQIQFRPSAPYALLVLLNYGRMSYASESAAHYGWVSQNEV